MGLLDKLKKAIAPARPTGVETEFAQGRVCAPASGRVTSLGDVPDPVFAGGLMGQGCAVWPEDETVYAPVSGTVSTAMSHAVGLRTDDGVEVLVHIGIDTVEMNGDGFEVFVHPDEHVNAGQPLVRVDREKIRAAGHPDCVVVCVTNSDDFASVETVTASGSITRAGMILAVVTPR